MSDEPKQARPNIALAREIMDSNVPKNDREWWAAGEIARLQLAITDLLKELIDMRQRAFDEYARMIDLTRRACAPPPGEER